MTLKTTHADCLWWLASTSAPLPRNSLVNSNKHVPIIKHWAPLVICDDAAHARWLGKPLEKRLVFEGPQRTHRHMTGCLFVSLISLPAPLFFVPVGEADPLLFYWANLKPNSSSQVFWLCAGGLLCIRCTAAHAVTQAITIVNCVFAWVWARFEVPLCCSFYFQSQSGTVIPYKRHLKINK